MTAAQNYIGKKFHSLTIKDVAGRNNYGRSIVNVECDCGVKKVVELYPIIRGAIKSCGCLKAKNLDQTKHGLSHHKLHGLLSSIKARCYNPNEKCYKNYGGRAITICDEWMNSFETFIKWCLANGWREGLQIDRIDNFKGYSPENCRFVTNKENQNNTRKNRWLTHEGQTHTVPQWAEIIGINSDLIRQRLWHGWPVERALTKFVKIKTNTCDCC